MNLDFLKRELEHSKTPGSEIDPERVHWGQIPLTRAGSICQVCRKLTNFRVSFYPEWSLAPMHPFPGHADPVFFRVKECVSSRLFLPVATIYVLIFD